MLWGTTSQVRNKAIHGAKIRLTKSIKRIISNLKKSYQSFNGTIWNRVSKVNHVGLSTLYFGVCDAITHFNFGEKAALDIMKLLKLLKLLPICIQDVICRAILRNSRKKGL